MKTIIAALMLGFLGLSLTACIVEEGGGRGWYGHHERGYWHDGDERWEHHYWR